jgi:hypothetical protein
MRDVLILYGLCYKLVGGGGIRHEAYHGTDVPARTRGAALVLQGFAQVPFGLQLLGLVI